MSLRSSRSSDRPPAALTVRIGAGAPTGDTVLHVYDAAGEFYAEREQNRLLWFLDEAQGFVFVLDPFSMQVVADQLTGSLRKRWRDASPARDDPLTSYEVTVQRLRVVGVPLQNRALAIVVVKADLLLDLPPELRPTPMADSDGVRQWLWDRDLRRPRTRCPSAISGRCGSSSCRHGRRPLTTR